MNAPRSALVGLPLIVALAVLPSRSALPDIGYHDNDRPAGRVVGDEVQLTLEIRRGTMHPNGPDRPGTPMLAFAEPEQPLRIPGPLLRVVAGTKLHVTIRNQSDSVLVIRGLADDPTRDSLMLEPGATRDVRFTVYAAGNQIYSGTFRGGSLDTPRGEDGHLAGALIVDASTTVRPKREQILMITGSYHWRDSTGALAQDREIFVVNGRPWPFTRRLTGAVGDSMRFHLLNASVKVHPIHLHGTYFRVDSRGSGLRDTALAPDQRRMVVTELLPPNSTMNMAWMPDRPGQWLMHCHLTFHVTGNIGFGADSLHPDRVYDAQNSAHHVAEPDHHVEQGMGGIMIAIAVPRPRGWKDAPVPSRVVRMIIPRDSLAGDTLPFYAPSIVADGRLSRPERRTGPGATLILHQGEPTIVRVINESGDHTAIHWHGMELENKYDGVVGLSIAGISPQHAIAPSDSFDARMTPPRAGTFIYHTHLMEVRQSQGGLVGPMIVLPAGESFDAERDHIYFVSSNRQSVEMLNGGGTLPTITIPLGVAQRIRLINVTTSSPLARLQLVRADTSLAQWTRLAKDGMDLPGSQRRTEPAQRTISMGETYDMVFTPSVPGIYRLELRNRRGTLRGYQQITVALKAP